VKNNGAKRNALAREADLLFLAGLLQADSELTVVAATELLNDRRSATARSTASGSRFASFGKPSGSRK
jgi:hypothetical protein